MDVLNRDCFYCGKALNPNAKTTYRRVLGWERRRDAGGTNAIALRQTADIFACPICIDRLKAGVAVEQQSFL